jgi:hypothetical protein
MTQAILLALFLAAPTAPAVPIYVGPQVKDGFVDVDEGVRDSIKDVQRALRWQKRTLRVVDDEASATLRLYVVRRTTTTGATRTYGSLVGGVGAVVGAPDKVKRLETVLRTGTYERDFIAEHKGWYALADRIAKDVSVWLAANRERVVSKP